MGEHLEARAKSALRQSRPARHSPHLPVLPGQQTDEPVTFTQRIAAKHHGLSFNGWHQLVGAPTTRRFKCRRPRALSNVRTYHSAKAEAIPKETLIEKISQDDRAANRTLPG
jgi:hypothetical protein